MVLALLIAFVAIRGRDIARHSAWMTRAYAIGLGAGTQLITHLVWIATVGQPGEASRALLMGAGWAINMAVAEAIIRRRLMHHNPSVSTGRLPPAVSLIAAADDSLAHSEGV